MDSLLITNLCSPPPLAPPSSSSSTRTRTSSSSSLRLPRHFPLLHRRRRALGPGRSSGIPPPVAAAAAGNGALVTSSVPPNNGVFTVGDFMTKREELHTVKPTTTVDEALQKLVENRITGFPVIDDDWKLVGVVSDYDLLALDSISGTGRTDTSLFPEADSTWKVQVPHPQPLPPQQQIVGADGSAAVAAQGGASGAAGANQFPTTSLYVGDLEVNVMDNQLYDLFNQVGPVVSVRVCRDITTRRSLGYAYVNFNNPVDAARALDMLNYTVFNGKPIRIMYSNRDPSTRRSGAANIFIKNLDKGIDNKALHDTFSAFGSILSCKVATDPSGQSKGYGFVQYEQEEAAEIAISKLNGMLLNGKQVFVGPFLRKQERDNSANKSVFSNVFVKNLSETITKENLEEIFGEYGEITSAIVMREGDGKSKCFGFVNFVKPEDAARAVEELNGKKIDDKEWYVGKAQKKSEREVELKGRFDQSAKDVADKFQGVNLYIKNLDDVIGDDKLRELFSEFGTITSCKVMRDSNGISRGSGFVAFSAPEDASRALGEMNGKMIGSKPLYVAVAQRKEDRRARLQAQFSQMRPVAIPAHVAPRLPTYHPGAPGLGQQLFYGQAPPALIPPQQFGYQQQLVHGMRPGGSPMPNFFVPMVPQGQPPQRPGGRLAGGGPVQQAQHVPMIPQQMIPRGGRVYRYPPGRNVPDVPMPGVPGGMLSVPYDMGGMPMRDAGMLQPIPVGALTSALANASPEQQRTMLGESLYPLVDQLEHESAAKVTGMLLEMDQTEVLHLLESPEALKAKVAEAMDVLRHVQPGTPTDQLASLSLNDGGIVS